MVLQAVHVAEFDMCYISSGFVDLGNEAVIRRNHSVMLQ